jgi:putative flippase GtrA
MRFIKPEIYRFILWGGINTLSGYVIYACLLLFLPYLASYSIAFVLGIFTSYLVNSKFVFNQQLRLRKALKYPLVYVTQYVLGAASLFLLVHVFRMDKLLAPALVLMVTIPITFVLSRRVVTGS